MLGSNLAKTDMEADGEKSVQLDASFPGKDKSDLLALEPIRPRELQPVRMEFARHRIPWCLAPRWYVGGFEHGQNERKPRVRG